MVEEHKEVCADSMTRSSPRSKDDGPKTRIAILGTGLAGLCAAHALSQSLERRARYDIHIFEKETTLGLDGSSLSVDDRRVDVPMRSINAGEQKRKD